MTREDARIEVIKLWHVWRNFHPSPANRPDGAEETEFFNYIAADEPYLLEFASSLERRRIVHDWLSQAGLVSA